MQDVKKTYRAPRLTAYGDVKQITLYSNQTNSDSPSGIANTAYPVHS